MQIAKKDLEMRRVGIKSKLKTNEMKYHTIIGDWWPCYRFTDFIGFDGTVSICHVCHLSRSNIAMTQAKVGS